MIAMESLVSFSGDLRESFLQAVKSIDRTKSQKKKISYVYIIYAYANVMQFI